MAIFISFIISGIGSSGTVSNEVIVGAFLNALEIIKRKLECEKNNINLSEKDLTKFKISEKSLKERIQELNLENQENDFVLDCTNKEKSELKEYVPLYDYHLVYYFRSDVNQKELKKKGFINDKGFIMYDPVHRKRMRPDIVNKKKMDKDEEQKEIESNIKNIDVGLRIKDKEIDSSKTNPDNNMVTLKKLPKSKYGVIKKKDKNKKKKEGKEKEKNEQSGSASGSDNEEEKPKEKNNEEEQKKDEETKGAEN